MCSSTWSSTCSTWSSTRASATDVATTAGIALATPVPGRCGRRAWRFVARNPTLLGGLACLALLLASALGAHLWTSRDPLAMSPTVRLRPPSSDRPFGTDHYGRDIYARTLHGGRISLRVGATVA